MLSWPGAASSTRRLCLGADNYAGALVCDGWDAYRRFVEASHQTYLAHLLRLCGLLRKEHPRSPLPVRVQTMLCQALPLQDRHCSGSIFAHGGAVARSHLIARRGAILERSNTIANIERLAAHLSLEFPAIFAFLFDATLDATGRRGEQAFRPGVVTRKIASSVNRAARGPAAQQTLASVRRSGNHHPRGDCLRVSVRPRANRTPLPASTVSKKSPR
jgi:hypothetical protein